MPSLDPFTIGIECFQNFVREILCEENVRFWREVEAFKSLPEDEVFRCINSTSFDSHFVSCAKYILFTGICEIYVLLILAMTSNLHAN